MARKKFEPLPAKVIAAARIERQPASSSKRTEYLSVAEARVLQQQNEKLQAEIAWLKREMDEGFGASGDVAERLKTLATQLEAAKEREARHVDTLEAMKGAMQQGHSAETIAAVIDEYIQASREELKEST